jgi:hypothetical protein
MLLGNRYIEYVMLSPILIIISSLSGIGRLGRPFTRRLVGMIMFMLLPRGGRAMSYERSYFVGEVHTGRPSCIR